MLGGHLAGGAVIGARGQFTGHKGHAGLRCSAESALLAPSCLVVRKQAFAKIRLVRTWLRLA
jgi:hypothetical protein